MYDDEKKTMFDDVGSKIKRLAKILFVIGIIGSVIGAIVFGWDRSYRDPDFLAGRFFLFLIGGILFSYIDSLLIFGFGELIDKTSETHISVKNAEKEIQKVKEAITNLEKEVKGLGKHNSESVPSSGGLTQEEFDAVKKQILSQ